MPVKGRDSGLIDAVGPRTRKVVDELALATEFCISDRSEVVNFRVTFHWYLDQLKANGAMVTSHVKYALKVRDIHSCVNGAPLITQTRQSNNSRYFKSMRSILILILALAIVG